MSPSTVVIRNATTGLFHYNTESLRTATCLIIGLTCEARLALLFAQQNIALWDNIEMIRRRKRCQLTPLPELGDRHADFTGHGIDGFACSNQEDHGTFAAVRPAFAAFVSAERRYLLTSVSE